MARKRGKSKSRRRGFKGVNAWNLAESLVQTNVLTKGAFNTGPIAFLVGRNTDGTLGHPNFQHANLDGVQVSLGELLGAGGTNAAAHRTAAWNRVKSNWMPMLVQTVGVRVGFAMAKKITKGFRKDVNKAIGMAGLSNEVKV